ncbi:M20 family metallopeptidase [Moorella sulfitireducens]|uniref:M20 family metallopeptidase n=1 Tax=Neomoorella sulfitireducens TaxID=2972948 RepID=UPI0021AC594F|nr:ArgE/DapE family deacylase [Moorella sulfitireducens]
MLKDKLLAAYDKEYPIMLLKELIAIPSETPPGEIVAIIKRIETEMRELGFKTEIVAKRPEKPNVIATLNPDSPGPTVVLYAHADCASIGEENKNLWTMDPYGGEIKDGKIFGNGAADAKSGIAQLIGACKTIIDSKIPLKGKIIFIASADGEKGDLEGAKWMYENGLLPKADFGINADASNLRIQHIFRGRAFYTLTVEGKVAHSNTPQLGINAISKMAKVIKAIDDARLSFKPHPIIPDSTKTFTTIQGGTKPNSMPARCQATLDVRLVPGQTIAGVTAELEAILDKLRDEDPELKVKLELMEFGAREVIEFPSDCRIVKEANRAFEEITGQKADNGAGPGSAGCIMYFANLGIPSIFFGPARLETAHQPDEFCSIENLDIATKVTALTVARIVAEGE